MAFGTLATLAIAAGVVGTATPLATSSARKKEAAAKEAQANSMAAMYGGSSSSASKPMTRAQMLAGNPSILSTPSSNGALSGRGRLLGN